MEFSKFYSNQQEMNFFSLSLEKWRIPVDGQTNQEEEFITAVFGCCPEECFIC